MNGMYFAYGLLVLVLAVMGAYQLDVAGMNPSEGTRWWRDSVAPWEGFQGGRADKKGEEGGKGKGNEEEDGDTAPGKRAPVDLYSTSPYHLLADRLAPVENALSCVNSRSCFATDAEAQLSLVGNYRQLTNNYKREYPDSCSALRQELVLGFYEATPL
jgi:hypothetical protein